MTLAIETFSNVTGGVSFFKAVGHPLVAKKASALIAEIAAAGPVGIYDPHGLADAFAELHDCSPLTIAASFVQDITKIGTPMLGVASAPVTDLAAAEVAAVFIVAFDAERLAQHIAHLVPDGARVFTLDAMRLDDTMLTNRRRYLDPINFATNFAFFREGGGHHTRLVTANYWSGYGAKDTSIWFTLLDGDGQELACWQEVLRPGATAIVVDSAEVKRRFGLGDFTGQLFLHVINAAGHDVVKYALDTYGDDASELSCTHDANAWPSDLYGGLPAPDTGEKVILWVQNSHPCAIPPGAVSLNRMGETKAAALDRAIPAFGTYALDVADLLPELAWPQQIEVNAGKHFVRPRYEVVRDNGRRRMAHANVERKDLQPDPKISELGNLLGKAYILPAPVLPVGQFRSIALPTPMTTAQAPRLRAAGSAACRATMRSHWTPTVFSTAPRKTHSPAGTAIWSWSTISPRAARPTAGCTGCSATRTGKPGTPRRRASAPISSTPL
jgi:hypothetical protein